MDNQKIENVLNLSLNSTMEERDKSLELNVGYDEADRTWELIVKYHGDIMRAADALIQIEPLIDGYAIVTLPESLINGFANLEEVEYIEKPKRLFFSILEGKRASCIIPVTVLPPNLSGKGVLVAVIDSGISYEHMDFRYRDGSTRILELWDQTIASDVTREFYPPEGFRVGTVFERTKINEALAQPTRAGQLQIVPSIDASGHGTAVTGIAAGNGNVQSSMAGVAPESELLIVKLGSAIQDGFPRTTELMRALTFVVNRAIFYGRAVAINLSFGNTYGPHDGTSLLERFMDNVSEIGKNVICVGSGNEGAAAGHVAGNFYARQITGGTRIAAAQRIELAIAAYETAINVQLWKNYADQFTLTIEAPNGTQIRIPLEQAGKHTIRIMNTILLIYVGEPTPYAVDQEIYIDFIPADIYIDAGIWVFIMEPEQILSGGYYFYLPSENVLSSMTRFYRPTPEVTLTIPSTAQKVITVGAYDVRFRAYADFSGRGYVDRRYESVETSGNSIKPDIVAPGVNIMTTDRNGSYASYTGTSFATPFVTGSAALLMEWGIVQGNDSYLYGEKVKAYFIRGAKQLPALPTPNPMTGWGALCVRDSLPLSGRTDLQGNQVDKINADS